MAIMFTKERLHQMRGRPVLDRAGQKIGGIEDVYLDDQTNEPQWLGLATGFFGSKHVIVPLQSAELREDALTVPYTKDKVKDAPDIGDADHVSPEKESELIAYYELRREAAPGETGKERVEAQGDDDEIDDSSPGEP